MKTKTILSFSLTAIFAVGMITAASAGGFASWIGTSDGGAEMKNAKTWRLTATALDTIPEKDELAGILAGFGWPYDNINPEDNAPDAFGITIHNADLNGDGKNDVRDSLQNKEGFHGHNFIFGPGTELSTFCVAEIVDAPTSGISIEEDQVKVNLRDSQRLGEFIDAAVGFAIVVDTDCPTTVPTGDVVDPEILEELGLDGLPLGIVILSVD